MHLNLSTKDLQNLNLSNLDLSNLRECNLQGTNLQCAQLQKADLKGANLKEANLSGAKLDAGYFLPRYCTDKDLLECYRLCNTPEAKVILEQILIAKAVPLEE